MSGAGARILEALRDASEGKLARVRLQNGETWTKLPGWLPIETAPKDGTAILVYRGPDYDPMWGVASWVDALDERYRDAHPGNSAATFDDAFKSGWMMWWSRGFEKHEWPQYWQPLPEPPKPEAT